MEVAELKNTVLKYVDVADERLLEMMLSLAENYYGKSLSVLTEGDLGSED